jgi:hypothetical protein
VLVTRLKFTGRSDNSTNDNSYKYASLPQHGTVQITSDVYEEVSRTTRMHHSQFCRPANRLLSARMPGCASTS